MSGLQETSSDRTLIAREFADSIHRLCSEAKVLLFGSTATKTNSDESDIDIFIELPDKNIKQKLSSTIENIAWELEVRYEVTIQVLVYESSEIWNTPRRSSPLITSLYRTGVAL